MEELIREARVFYQASSADDKCRSYLQNLQQPAGKDDRIGFELVLFNEKESVPEIKLGFKFLLVAGSGKTTVWKFSETVHLPNPGTELSIVQFCEQPLAVGQYVVEIVLGGDRVKQLRFEVIKPANSTSTPENIPIEILVCNLYEAPEQGFYEINQSYSNQFETTQSRFIVAECIVKNKNENYFSDELEFHFKPKKGSTIGIDKVQMSISPEAKTTIVRGSWGSPQKGSWGPGKYEVLIKYKKEVLHKLDFECFEQGEMPPPEAFGPEAGNEITKYLDIDPKALKPFPDEITDQGAVILAYKTELDKIAGIIGKGQSVLISCDKILVEYL